MKYTITGEATDLDLIARILDTIDTLAGIGTWTCDIPATEGPA